jgi:hypothetical protein
MSSNGKHRSIPIIWTVVLVFMLRPLPQPRSSTILFLYKSCMKLIIFGHGLYRVYEKCYAILLYTSLTCSFSMLLKIFSVLLKLNAKESNWN